MAKLSFDQFALYALNNLAVKGELFSFDLKKLIDSDFARDQKLQSYSMPDWKFYPRIHILEKEGFITFREVRPSAGRGRARLAYTITQDRGFRKRADLQQTASRDVPSGTPELGYT